MFDIVKPTSMLLPDESFFKSRVSDEAARHRLQSKLLR